MQAATPRAAPEAIVLDTRLGSRERCKQVVASCGWSGRKGD
jgi:hypothetical protein